MTTIARAAYMRGYWERNKERLRQYHRDYAKAHRARRKARQDGYRPRRRVIDSRRREAHKQRAIKLLGGRCLDCGFDDMTRPEVFDFDHIGPKTTNIAAMKLRKWAVIETELSECELVCANCHRSRTERRRGKDNV